MRFIRPEMNITKFDSENVVTTSGYTLLTAIEVNGEEVQAQSYGAQNFSIFTTETN